MLSYIWSSNHYLLLVKLKFNIIFFLFSETKMYIYSLCKKKDKDKVYKRNENDKISY